ncbi:MAG TPA: FAD-dependent oxidoreductase, partial [Burkholderiales bacterium]
MHIPLVEPGTLGPCPVAPDALRGIKRQQTNPARWNGANWDEFAGAVRARGIEVLETTAARAAFATDAGGTAYGLAHGVVIARSTEQVALLLQAAQQHRVPVTVCGGGLTTEGESVAFGGVLLDMTGMSRVLHIDAETLTVRTEAGIFW